MLWIFVLKFHLLFLCVLQCFVYISCVSKIGQTTWSCLSLSLLDFFLFTVCNTKILNLVCFLCCCDGQFVNFSLSFSRCVCVRSNFRPNFCLTNRRKRILTKRRAACPQPNIGCGQGKSNFCRLLSKSNQSLVSWLNFAMFIFCHFACSPHTWPFSVFFLHFVFVLHTHMIDNIILY